MIPDKQAARLMHDGALALAEMTRQGVRIDVGYLTAEITKTEGEIDRIKEEMLADRDGVWTRVQRAYGNRAKVNSREQLGTVIFDQMGFPRGRSMSKKVNRGDEWQRKRGTLDEASFSKCPLEYVKLFFRWKKLEKLLTTYYYDIRRNLVHGRVHPQFHLNRVTSYRSSGSDPNTMNIPKRNKSVADRVRRCYIPDPGCEFIDLDYAGAEVCSACNYTLDPNLMAMVGGEGDTHGDLAARVLGCKKPTKSDPKEWLTVWKEGPRDWGKNRIVFPFFFGSTHHNAGPHFWDAVERGYPMHDGSGTVMEHLAKQGIKELGDPEAERTREGTFLHRVKQVEEWFWKERFKVFGSWKNRWYYDYCRNGFCKSLSGFVYSGLLGKNDIVNYPIQGFAFHWTLLTIIEVTKELKRRKLKSRMWNEIHDSTVANCPRRERDDYIDLIIDVMTRRVPERWPSINVKLSASVEIVPEGMSWAEKADAFNKDGRWEVVV